MAGKESALQEGFDDGFASAAASSGRELGVLRGIASALLSFIVSYSSYRLDQDSLVKEARLIQSNLADIRFADIILRDVDSERHARQHSNSVRGQSAANEGVMNELQAVFGTTIKADRPAMDNARQLKKQLQDLTRRLGLTISLDWHRQSIISMQGSRLTFQENSAGQFYTRHDCILASKSVPPFDLDLDPQALKYSSNSAPSTLICGLHIHLTITMDVALGFYISSSKSAPPYSLSIPSTEALR